jgi:hypothetical protein
MTDRLYIETTVVSYLTARPSRDLIIAAHQQITREWWDKRRKSYKLCVSDLVLNEAQAGSPQAARDRYDMVASLPVIETTAAARSLAKSLVDARAVPRKAAADALHIAIAAAYAVPYLLTWNCRHLANAAMRLAIESTCLDRGVRAPIICTPEELLEQEP